MKKGRNHKGILHRTAIRILLQTTYNPPGPSVSSGLSNAETKAIHSIMTRTYVFSALLGALGVIILFSTRYAFPALFPKTTLHIPLFGISFHYNFAFMLYGVALAYVELYFLYYINLLAIGKMMGIYRHPHPSHPNYLTDLEKLAEVGVEKNRPYGKEIGVNPYQGIPRMALGLYLLVNFYKAAISNIIIRTLVSRLGGKVVGRVFLDMLGVPVFAFWNIMVSRKVLREARVRIICQPVIENFVMYLNQTYGSEPEFHRMIYDALQYSSKIKRSYNYAMFTFGHTLLRKFQIPVQSSYTPDPNFKEKLKSSPPDIKKGIERVIIFGTIIDGYVNTSEFITLKREYEDQIISMPPGDIIALCRGLRQGAGVGPLMD